MNTYKNKKPLLAFALTMSLALGMAGNVNQVIAGTATDSLGVSASIANKCKLNNTVPVSFGAYDPVDANETAALDATGSFDVKCTKGGTGTLKLDAGLYAANASGTTRAMKASGGETYLDYDLYTANDHATVWDDTSNTVVYGPAVNASYSTESVYGEIPGGQINASADSYADTVTITVAY